MTEPNEVSDRLAERYEGLLEAYPEGYRAERGEEILGTLLDGAKPGQPAYTSMFELALVGALLAVLRSGRTLRPPSVWMAVALVVAFTAPASYFQVVMVYRWDLLFGLGLLAGWLGSAVLLAGASLLVQRMVVRL